MSSTVMPDAPYQYSSSCEKVKLKGLPWGLTNVTESLRVFVAIVIAKAGILLRTVVPGELEKTFAISGPPAFRRNPLCAWIAKEVKVKSGLFVFHSPHQRHPQSLLIELQGCIGRLDADHGMVLSFCASACTKLRRSGAAYHAIGLWIGVLHSNRIFEGILANDFHPVSIGVKHESNVTHAAICEFLLEFDAGVLQPLAGSLQVIDTE